MNRNRDNHLPLRTITTLYTGRLSALQRKRAAEHVSSCPQCALAVAEFFSGQSLIAAPAGFSGEVLRKARQADTGNSLAVYSLKVLIAACIALALLFSDVSARLMSGISEIQAPDLGFAQTVSASLNSFSENILFWEVFDHEKEER